MCPEEVVVVVVAVAVAASVHQMCSEEEVAVEGQRCS